MVLKLNEDSTYCHYAVNFYSFGKWRWNNKSMRLLLTPTSGNTVPKRRFLEISLLRYNMISTKKIIKSSNGLTTEHDSTIFNTLNTQSKIDPLSLENNTWRIRPMQPETPEQIKKRTVDYLKFVRAYNQHLLDANIIEYTTGWYPKPVLMQFGNGVRMAYDDELNDWYACFYNKDQAIEGYKLMSGSMYYITIHHKENLLDRNIDVIDQLLKLIH
jgi:hypothetical protein